MSDAKPKPKTEAEQLEERLETARAARAAREAAGADDARLEKLKAEVEAEERANAEEQIIEELVKKHGKRGKFIEVVQTPEGMVVVKRPNHLLWQKFVDTESAKSDDLDQLVRPCLVHPSKTEFDRICKEVPATLAKCANAVTTLAGFRKEDLGKK